MRNIMLRLGVVLLAVALSNCSGMDRPGGIGTPAFDAATIATELTPDIETLYLSWHALDQIYKDLKFLERGFLFDPHDRQLGYIQKTSLYIQDASVRVHHQWEQLSMLHYIRLPMMRDYLTISANGLTSTMDEVEYDRMFVEIYIPFIDHHAVTEMLDRARIQMNKTNGVMNRILQKLKPTDLSTMPPAAI